MRWRHKILLTLGAVLGVMVVAAGLYHWYLKSVNEAYIARLAAQGEPMTLAQVLPPAVPAAENSAEIFLRAAALLEADSSLLRTDSCRVMLTTTPGKALVCSQLPEMHGYDSTNPWPVLAQALLTNRPALALLLKLANHPTLDFQIGYAHCLEDSTLFTNLHLVELRKSDKYLRAELEYCLHNVNVAGAMQYWEAELVLVQATQNHRLQISQWVRLAMVYGLQNACWEILQSPGVAETQLAQLQNEWEKLDFIRSSSKATAMERTVGEIALGDWRQSTAAFEQYLGIGKSARIAMGMPDDSESLRARISNQLQIFLWHYWWSYPDELRALKGYQVLLDASRLVETNRSFKIALARQEAGLNTLQITNSPDVFTIFFSALADTPDYHSMLSESVENLSSTIDKVLIAETTRQMTIAAIALQRFKLAHGQFPAQLSTLVPAYVNAVPLDPVDGQPLRYRPLSDGNFLLYSVGENGVDDGRNPAPSSPADLKYYNWLGRQNLDWVWPCSPPNTAPPRLPAAGFWMQPKPNAGGTGWRPTTLVAPTGPWPPLAKPPPPCNPAPTPLAPGPTTTSSPPACWCATT